MKYQGQEYRKAFERRNPRFRLVIDTDNAAFEDSPTGEIARILRQMADDIEETGDVRNPRDYNGNQVGTASLA